MRSIICVKLHNNRTLQHYVTNGVDCLFIVFCVFFLSVCVVVIVFVYVVCFLLLFLFFNDTIRTHQFAHHLDRRGKKPFFKVGLGWFYKL